MSRPTTPKRRSGPRDEPGPAPPEVTLRRCRTYAEFEECVALQRETWGDSFTECVPPAILMVGQKIGGVTAGAFGPDGRLLGFVFGLTGVREGRPVHWSDMLAVREEARGRGLGKRLKAYQRELLLETGVDVAYWTYDPLVARNAHLNLNHLGTEIREYVPDMYGADTGSELHSGLGTDRFVVVWKLRDPRVERTLAGEGAADPGPAAQAPVANADPAPGGARPLEREPPQADAVRIEIPEDIQAVKSTSPETAARWRASTRRAFLHYLGHGYRVTTFYRDRESGRCFYVLQRGAP